MRIKRLIIVLLVIISITQITGCVDTNVNEEDIEIHRDFFVRREKW